MITKGQKVEKVKGIFITHLHGDHSNGIFSFIDLINWYYTKCDPVIFIPNIDAKKVFDLWLETTKALNRELKYEETFSGTIFEDENIKVTAQKTMHCNRSFSYLVESNNKKVLFTGDLCRPDKDFPNELCENGIDIAIFEAAHFPATEYSEVIKKHNIKTVYFNHYAPWNIPNIQKLSSLHDDLTVKFTNDGMELQI